MVLNATESSPIRSVIVLFVLSSFSVLYFFVIILFAILTYSCHLDKWQLECKDLYITR